MKNLFRSMAVLALVASPICSAEAATVLYGTRSEWEAASISVTVIEFEGLAAPGSYVDIQGSSLSGVTFTGSYGSVFVFDPAFSSAYNWGTGATLGFNSETITATFGPGVTAVGLDLMWLGISFNAPLNFLLSSGETISVPINYFSNFEFFGLTTDVAISQTSIDLYAPPPYFASIDNFSFGANAALPEPGSLALISLAFVVLGLMRSTRRSKN